MKKLSIVLLLVVLLLGGCTSEWVQSSLIVQSVKLTESGTWKIAIGDEYSHLAVVYLVFEEQPGLQAGDRIELVKVEE